MHRLVSLLAVGLLASTAAVVGVAARARPEQKASTQAEEIAAKARHIGPGGTVKVTLTDGRKLAGKIIGLSDTDLRLLATEGHDSGEHVIPYADIASIKEKGSRTALWIVLGVAIGILVPIGLCAASL